MRESLTYTDPRDGRTCTINTIKDVKYVQDLANSLGDAALLARAIAAGAELRAIKAAKRATSGDQLYAQGLRNEAAGAW